MELTGEEIEVLADSSVARGRVLSALEAAQGALRTVNANQRRAKLKLELARREG